MMTWRRARRVGWSTVAQGISSISNLLLGVAVARAADEATFGVFGLLFGAYLVALALARGLVNMPLMLAVTADRASGDPDETAAVAASGGLGVAVGAVVAFAAVVGVPSGDRPLALVFAVFLPVLLVQDTWRHLFFARNDQRSVATNDFVWLAVQLLAMAAAWAAGMGAAPYLAGWGLGAATAALVGFRQANARLSFRTVNEFFRANRDVAGSLTAESVAAVLGAQAATFVVALVLTVEDVAGVRGAQLLLAPISVLFTGAQMVAMPAAVRIGREERIPSFLPPLSAGLAGVAAIAGVTLHILPDFIGAGILGESWESSRALLAPTAANLVGTALMIGAFIVLRARRQAKATLQLQVANVTASAAAAVCAGTVAGVAGAVWGASAVTILVACAAWMAVMRKPDHRSDVRALSVSGAR